MSYMLKPSIVFLLLLIFGLVNAASCAENAYRKACAACPFDANGKMDKNCYDSYQQSGISCIARVYPIATAKHAAGQCPQLDKCAEKLRECLNIYSEYTDKEKCEIGTAQCFSDVDRCVLYAAADCGEKIEPPCGLSFILLSIPLFVLVGNFLK